MNDPNTVAKIDLFRLHKADYVASRTPVFIRPERGQYLLVDGYGAPGSELFSSRIAALYGMAFTIKMTRKFEGLQDYAMGKMECRYPGLPVDGSPLPPADEWRWELFVRTPDFVSETDLAKGLAALRKRKKAGDADRVPLEEIEEGPSVQMLHVGPYERLGESYGRLREAVREEGQCCVGPSHEIYLSDPRRVAPEKLRTLLRLPVGPRGRRDNPH